MKKRQLTIEEDKDTHEVYTIMINNVRYLKDFNVAIETIIREFLSDKEVFFGLCRIDGMNLSLEEQKKLRNKIPAFFKKNGDIENLNEHLTVARTKLNKYSVSFIPLIFDYYLETMIFSPKVDWGSFKRYHFNYQKHRFDSIIRNHFADILFYYYDSGDFLICFNPQVYNYQKVRGMIDQLF